VMGPTGQRDVEVTPSDQPGVQGHAGHHGVGGRPRARALGQGEQLGEGYAGCGSRSERRGAVI
jgi:hypothetical protein